MRRPQKILSILALSSILLLGGAFQLPGQVKIIFDTDFGGDADDLGALAMLNHLVDRGECELLAVMCWSTEKYAVSGIDAVNRYYGHSEIPIGTRKDPIHLNEWNYSRPIADQFPFELDQQSAREATDLYRQILSQSTDGSIVIVTVGPLKNIQNLLESTADAHSDLDGKALVKKKVKEFVIMGGKFPEGEKEWNFDGGMPGVTRNVIGNLKVPITFSGFEVGAAIKSGEVFNDIDSNTPLYMGFMHFSQNAPWIKENFKGKILDNSTFDQTAVLYAVRDKVGDFWERVEGGYCQPDDVGGNKWIPKEATNQSYLRLTANPELIAQAIEALMLGEF